MTDANLNISWLNFTLETTVFDVAGHLYDAYVKVNDGIYNPNFAKLDMLPGYAQELYYRIKAKGTSYDYKFLMESLYWISQSNSEEELQTFRINHNVNESSLMDWFKSTLNWKVTIDDAIQEIKVEMKSEDINIYEVLGDRQAYARQANYDAALAYVRELFDFCKGSVVRQERHSNIELPETATVQDVAQRFLFFVEEVFQRKTGGIPSYILEARAPEYVKSLCIHVNALFNPKDYRMCYLQEALEWISNVTSEDGFKDYETEADIANEDLTAWLHSSHKRAAFTDEANEEFGNAKFSIYAAIASGQIAEKESVYEMTLKYLNTKFFDTTEDYDVHDD